MPQNRKALFLTISGRNGASSRYRVYDYLPWLEAAGIDSTVMPPDRAAGRGLEGLFHRRGEEERILDAAAASDVVFVQKRLFSKGLIYRLKATGRPLVFDFDDAIFTSPRGDWSFFTRGRVAGRLSVIMNSARLVIAGNRYLRDYAVRSGANLVEVLPTAIDVSRYGAKKHGEGPPVLGWIGSSVNHGYLDMLAGALREVSRRFEGLRLLVVSDRDYCMEGVQVENRRWSEDTEARDILDMDMGLMPLADDAWTRGKCALKALQYMASGIPAVCSPVGANNEVVEDGVDGFLPAGRDEWVSRLSELAGSPEMRAAMGRSGRVKVAGRFSTAASGARLASMLGSL